MIFKTILNCGPLKIIHLDNLNNLSHSKILLWNSHLRGVISVQCFLPQAFSLLLHLKSPPLTLHSQECCLGFFSHLLHNHRLLGLLQGGATGGKVELEKQESKGKELEKGAPSVTVFSSPRTVHARNFAVPAAFLHSHFPESALSVSANLWTYFCDDISLIFPSDM